MEAPLADRTTDDNNDEDEAERRRRVAREWAEDAEERGAIEREKATAKAEEEANRPSGKTFQQGPIGKAPGGPG
jgi:hypothetical protein